METPAMIKDRNNNPIPVLRFGQPQTIDGTSATTQSTVLDSEKDSVARIAALADIWVNISENPLSVADACYYYPSGMVEYVNVPKNFKISALGGKLNIVPCY